MRFLDQFQISNTDLLLVGPENAVKQSFIAGKNNLSGIRVGLSNATLGGKKAYQISLSDSSGIIRSQDISESNIGWKVSFRYDFPPIGDSNNKSYTLIINPLYQDASEKYLLDVNKERSHIAEMTSLTGEEKRILQSEYDKKYINVLYNKIDAYKAGSAYLNNIPLSGDIEFETYYSAPASSAVTNIYHNIFTNLFSDPGFLIFYVVLLIGLLIGIYRNLPFPLRQPKKLSKI